MDAPALRAAFPACERLAYLNTGTCGPLPAACARAGREALDFGAREGRGPAFYERFLTARDRLRAAYAGLLGAQAEDVAVTTSTSDGLGRVLAGFGLRPGDEILTADDEHPGLYGPLAAARRQRGVSVRMAPLAALADAVRPSTRLIACSHVSWASGQTAPVAELAAAGVPVVLDGAQGIGAVPVDVAELGCAAYAGSGQKWLCGPVGTGMLWVSPGLREQVAVRAPAYANLADPDRGLEAAVWPDGRRFDTPGLSLDAVEGALAALGVLAAAGWTAVHERAASLAQALAGELGSRGHRVAARGATTLVAWEHEGEDPAAAVERMGAAGVVVRAIPGTERLRASIGAFNDESDLERLLAALDR